MCEFKVGDKVRRVGDSFDGIIKGQIYRVESLPGIRGVKLEGVVGAFFREKFELVEETKPHKHAAIIKQWADGKKIQVMNPATLAYQTWVDTDRPQWHTNYEYRVKPEVKPDRVGYMNIVMSTLGNKPHEKVSPEGHEGNNVQFTFDGETGKLKAVSLINN